MTVTIKNLLDATDRMLNTTGEAPCPVCQVGRLSLAIGTAWTTCTNCGSLYHPGEDHA